MNNINIIAPYKWEGIWVFDDARVGLEQEPFVSGADDMIDVLIADIPNADAGFHLTFSGAPFPGHQVVVEWRREEYGGQLVLPPESRHGRLALSGAYEVFSSCARSDFYQSGCKGVTLNGRH